MGIDFKVFSDKKQNSEIKGRIDDIKPYVIQNKVDEIYCSLNEISNEKLKELVEFADDNKKTIKFIPEKDIFQRTLRLIIMSFFLFCLCKKQLHNPAIIGLKRFFDILFLYSL
jgi:putative colanic acid biosynthesis UDP-glucose lipid carrier transferase